jgi:hypothetical protein
MHDEVNRDKKSARFRALQKTLVDDVNRMMDRAEKRAVGVNLAKMKEEEEKAELLQIKRHRNVLLE